MGASAGKPGARRYIMISIIVLFLICAGIYFFLFIPKQEVRHLNLKYGSSPNQALDIYTPKVQNGKRLPVIIYVHGGGWRGGDKGNVDTKPSYFIDKGFVFVSVEHRFSPQVTYTQMEGDISKAVKWIYDHADTYHIDRNKMNLMGHSSGGHLVLLLGTNPKFLSQAGLQPGLINSIVSLEGPLNLTEFFQRLGGYKKVFGNDKKVWEEASPETYAANKNLPPMLLVTRRRSSISAFVETARKAGNSVSFFECKTLSHSEVTQLLGSSKGSAEAQKMTKTVLEFLQKYNI